MTSADRPSTEVNGRSIANLLVFARSPTSKSASVGLQYNTLSAKKSARIKEATRGCNREIMRPIYDTQFRG